MEVGENTGNYKVRTEPLQNLNYSLHSNMRPVPNHKYYLLKRISWTLIFPEQHKESWSYAKSKLPIYTVASLRQKPYAR